MKNVYVLAALVVLFGGVLAGCTKNKEQKDVVAPAAVEETMKDDSSKMMDDSQAEDKDSEDMSDENKDKMDNKDSEKEDESDDQASAAVQYTVSTSDSVMNWTGAKIASSHTGTINLTSGSFMMKDGMLQSGEFVVDMTSMLEDGKENGLIKHLKNEDFFDVSKHPTSKFVVTSSKAVSESKVEVTGDLTIKGITNPITFVADYTLANEGLTFDAKFSIDRTKWDIKYGSGSFFDDLGDKAIKDNIDYQLEIVAKK